MGTVGLLVQGSVAELTISASARHNAMSLAMWIRLRELVDTVGNDPGVRVVVLRGEGQEAFVSGADISEFESNRATTSAIDTYDRAVDDAQKALMQCPKPVIASIRGICMGGGMGLALACDLRYATRTARFRMPAARLGLGYRYEGIRRFVEIVGAAHAAELFLTARTFDGIEAERIGVVHRAHDASEHDAAVAAIVADVAQNAPLSLLAAKRTIAAIAAADPAITAGIDALVAQCMASDDYVEGRRAFAEKRLPRFRGQ